MSVCLCVCLPARLSLSLSFLLSACRFSVGDALDEDDLDAELACLDDELDVSGMKKTQTRKIKIVCWLDDLTWEAKMSPFESHLLHLQVNRRAQ